MYNYDTSEENSNSYWKTEMQNNSDDLLSKREKHLLVKYLRKSARHRKLHHRNFITISKNEDKNIQESPRKSYTIKKSNVNIIWIFFLISLFLFLRPIKSNPIGYNPMLSGMYGLPQQPLTLPQGITGPQLALMGQQYPLQTQIYRPSLMNQIPPQLSILNPNPYGTINTGLNPFQNSANSQLEANLMDKLLKVISTNGVKKTGVDTQSVKNTVNILLSSLGIPENRINLVKLDSAKPDFVSGYNEAVIDMKREIDIKFPPVMYSPFGGMNQFAQLTHQANAMNPSSISPYQLMPTVPQLSYPYNLLQSALIQPLTTTTEKESEEAEDKKKSKHKSHKKKSHRDEEDEEDEHESRSHRKKSSHRGHRRRHRYS